MTVIIITLEIVESVFAANEVASGDTKKFVPHLTIAKMSKMAASKNRRWKKKKKKGKKEKAKESSNDLNGIDPSTYSDLVDTEFGAQPIEGLELLSMTFPPDKEAGYYYCFERHFFSQDDGLPSLSIGCEDEPPMDQSPQWNRKNKTSLVGAQVSKTCSGIQSEV